MGDYEHVVVIFGGTKGNQNNEDSKDGDIPLEVVKSNGVVSNIQHGSEVCFSEKILMTS